MMITVVGCGGIGTGQRALAIAASRTIVRSSRSVRHRRDGRAVNRVHGLWTCRERCRSRTATARRMVRSRRQGNVPHGIAIDDIFVISSLEIVVVTASATRVRRRWLERVG